MEYIFKDNNFKNLLNSLVEQLVKFIALEYLKAELQKILIIQMYYFKTLDLIVNFQKFILSVS